MASTPFSQTRVSRRRSLTRPASLPLRFETLEDRSVPSFSFPLTGGSWGEFGPRNIAVQPSHTGEPGQGTSSPGGLASSGRITQVAPDPNNLNVFYAATAGGGVWKTTDYGDTWRSLTDRLPLATTPGLTDDLRTLAMGSVTLSPLDSNIVYAGEGEQNNSGDSFAGNGILKSLDGGATWKLISGPGNAFLNTTIPHIIVLPNPAAPTDTTKELVFALVGQGPGSSVGIWRSKDGGDTWVKITGLLNSQNGVSPFRSLTDLAVDPSNPNVAYVAVGDPSGNNASRLTNGVYKTVNALSDTPDVVDPPNTPPGSLQGTPWTTVFGGNGQFVMSGALMGRINFVLAPTSTSTLYVAVGSPGGSLTGVFRTQNGGTDWRQYPTVPNFVPGQSNYNLAIDVDPTNENRIVMVGLGGNMVTYTNDALNSDPAAVTWSNLTLDSDGQGPHTDAHTVKFTAKNANGQRQLLVGSDGGMFRTVTFDPTGAAVDWESANGLPGQFALGVVQYVGIALHPQSADEMVGGTQDNGTLRFFDDGTSMDTKALDGTAIKVPEAWAGPLSDGGDSGKVVYDFLNNNNVYQASPVASKGTAGFVRKSTDGGKTWAAITNGITNPQASLFYPPIEIDPSQPNRLFLGTDAVNETTDGGASWHQLAGKSLPFVTGVTTTDGSPKPVVTAIGISRFDPDIIFVAVNNRGFSVGNVVVGFGPAIYRINLRENPPGPFWRDISPSALAGDGSQSTPRGVGIPLPGETGAPNDPQPNALSSDINTIASDPFTTANWLFVDNSHEVVRSPSSGSTWGILNPTGLPNGSLQQTFQDIVLDPNLLGVGGQLDDILYVATNIGVYTLSNPTQPFATQAWTRLGGEGDQTLGDDVRNKIGYHTDAHVDDLALNTTTGLLVAATHGRGLWQYQTRPYVSGVVFEDKNGNGIRDENGNGVFDTGDDKGLPNVRVVANRIEPAPPFEAANTFSFVGATNADPRIGFYVFRSLQNGKYEITTGLGSRLPVDPANTFFITTPPLILQLDQNSTIPTADVGVFTRVSVSGLKFNDRNKNGTQDANEAGLAGWTFQLYDSADPATNLASVVSGADGKFVFNGLGQLPAGHQFRIREVPQPGWVATTAADQAVPAFTSGQNITGITFGNVITGSLQITGWPNPPTVPAGTPITFTLTVLDQFNNVFTGYNGTVHLTSTDGGAATTINSGAGGFPFPLDYTFNPAVDGGKHTFTVVFTTAGVQTLDVVSATDLGITGTAASLFVTAGAPDHLRLLGLPTSVIAGQVTTVTVTAADKYGNQTNFTGPVTFTGTDPQGSLPPNAALSNGAGQFAVVLRTAGNQTITVSDPANVLAAASATTRVDSAAGSKFLQIGVPATSVAGNAFVFTVLFQDAFGNAATGPVHFTSTDPQATLPADYTFTAADGGQHTFAATYRTAGTQTLTATGPTNLVTPATGTTQVTAAATSKYTVSGYPSPAQTGTTATVTVAAIDAFGNPTTGTITVTSTDGAAVLPAGPITVNGTATFNVTLNTVGTQSIVVSDGTASGSEDGIQITPVPPPPPPPPPPNPVTLPPIFAIGSDEGPLNFVRVFNQDQTVRTQFQPFDPGLFGGARVTTAGTPTGFRIVAVPGPGLYQDVKVFESDRPVVIRTFQAFERSFSGGLFVASADFNGDGWADYILSPDEGGGPRVQIVDGQSGGMLADFLGIDDPNFRGGARTAAADINHDGVPDLVVAAGFGGGPRVAIYDGKSIIAGSPVKLVSDFFLFEQTLRNGVYIAAGDLNGDGFADVVAGGGPGGGPRVLALDGKTLLAGQTNTLTNFFAGDPANRGGIRVTVKNLDNDNQADILVGSGPGVPTRATAYAGKSVIGAIQPPELFSLDATLGNFAGGVFVG